MTFLYRQPLKIRGKHSNLVKEWDLIHGHVMEHKRLRLKHDHLNHKLQLVNNVALAVKILIFPPGNSSMQLKSRNNEATCLVEVSSLLPMAKRKQKLSR